MKVWYYFSEDPEKQIYEKELPDVMLIMDEDKGFIKYPMVVSASLPALIEARERSNRNLIKFHEEQVKKHVRIQKALEFLEPEV